MLTGLVGSTPSVLGLICLAYVPAVTDTPTPEPSGGIAPWRKKKVVKVIVPKEVEDDILPMLITLLLEG